MHALPIAVIALISIFNGIKYRFRYHKKIS